jgi:hypothetical protein
LQEQETKTNSNKGKFVKKISILALLAAFAAIPSANAANVNLTGIDGIGASSFNTAGLWSDALAPSAGNDYFVGNGTRLRTPADGNSHTFAGDSLTINNTTAYGDGFMYKGTGSAGAITVNNLILDGGLISHANGSGDLFNLYGNINVASSSRLYPKQGPINIYSAISGSSTLNILASDANAAFKIWIRSSANTFTGDIVNNGRMELADDANLNFVIGASGVNNRISNGLLGTQQHSIFDGDFVLDLSGAGTTLGDSWSLVSTAPASTYYNSTFTVLGFTDIGGELWQGSANGATYEFSELTGVLMVVPEPSCLALVLGGAALLGVRRMRKA